MWMLNNWSAYEKKNLFKTIGHWANVYFAIFVWEEVEQGQNASVVGTQLHC